VAKQILRAEQHGGGIMTERILFVDDEPAVLLGYQRLLHHDLKVDTAVGGPGALIALQTNGPYAIVVSDMHMPQMDGIELLTRVKAISPNTIRIILTGNADIQTAVTAVNRGNVFRFLTKPCSREDLCSTLSAGLEQYRLLHAEKELLENTLRGIIQVLIEVLSLVNPAAFSRAERLRRYMSHILRKLSLTDSWKFEVAAMMSQLGCVSVDPDTIEAVHAGRKLSPRQQALYDTHPMIASDLLRKVPRMEQVAWMIAHQNEGATVDGSVADQKMEAMWLGAELLRVTLAFDKLLVQNNSRTEAVHLLSRQFKDLDRRIFEALAEVDPYADARVRLECSIDELSAGMQLESDVRTHSGQLVVAKGQDVTMPLILKLKTFRDRGTIAGKVAVSVQDTQSKHAAFPDLGLHLTARE